MGRHPQIFFFHQGWLQALTHELDASLFSVSLTRVHSTLVMVYLVKDTAKLCSLVIANSPLLMALKCLVHGGSVLIMLFVFDCAVGLHRLLIDWSLLLLIPFCSFIDGRNWLLETIFHKPFLASSKRLPWLLVIRFICSFDFCLEMAASMAFLGHESRAADPVTTFKHTGRVCADRVVLKCNVLLVVWYKSLSDLVIERVSEEFPTETDLISLGRLHGHLFQSVAMDGYQSPMISFAFILNCREPRVQVHLLQVVLLVLRPVIAFVTKALSGFSSTTNAHYVCLKLDAILFLYNCSVRVRS